MLSAMLMRTANRTTLPGYTVGVVFTREAVAEIQWIERGAGLVGKHKVIILPELDRNRI